MYHVLNRSNARMTIFDDEATMPLLKRCCCKRSEDPDAAAGVLPDAEPLASWWFGRGPMVSYRSSPVG